VVWAQAGR